MKRLALALAALLAASPAAAQSQLPPSTIWGNFATVSDYPAPEIVPACSGALTFTAGTGFGCGPGAVNLIPLNNTWTGVNTFTLNTGFGAAVPANAPVTINTNTAPDSVQVGADTHLFMIGADGVTNSARWDSFAASNSIVSARYEGTNAAKLPTALGSQIFAVNAFGWDGTALGTASILRFYSADNWTTTAHGGYASIFTTPNGTTTPQEMARFQPSGGLSVGSANVASDLGNGRVLANTYQALGPNTQFYAKATGATNGSIYIDTSQTGQQSSITYADNGVAKWQVLRQSDNTYQVYDVVGAKPSMVAYPNGGVDFNPGSLPDPGPGNIAASVIKNAIGTVTATVASGQTNMAAAAIASASCAAVVNVAATGTIPSDTVIANFSGDPTGITGYIPSTSGMLTIFVWPVTNGVDFKVCNNTAAAITPGVVTLNYRVVR